MTRIANLVLSEQIQTQLQQAVYSRKVYNSKFLDGYYKRHIKKANGYTNQNNKNEDTSLMISVLMIIHHFRNFLGEVLSPGEIN